MAIKSGFWGSTNGDRTYSGEDLMAITAGLVSDGVYQHVLGKFAVSVSGTSATISVATGRLVKKGRWFVSDSVTSLTLPAYSPSGTRLDAVVVRFSTVERSAGFAIVQGEIAPTGDPVPPTLSETDVLLAYILRSKTVNTVTSASINNRVGTVDSPYAGAMTNVVDISNHALQWGAQFDEWLLSVQNRLTENQITNLQALILQIQNNYVYSDTKRSVYVSATTPASAPDGSIWIKPIS